MKLETRHAVILFFLLLFIDLFIYLISVGETGFRVGWASTQRAAAVPATLYLALCFFAAMFSLKMFDAEREPQWSHSFKALPWVLAGFAVFTIIAVSGRAFFSIDALERAILFRQNPWIAGAILAALPLAMAAIVSARPRDRFLIFFILAGFFFFSGSRIHLVALVLAFVSSGSSRKVRMPILLLAGFAGLVFLDLLAQFRQGAPVGSYANINLIGMFTSGHYSNFDIQTILMDSERIFGLEPEYLIVAAMGPFRHLFGFGAALSASEYFTLAVDPSRFYRGASLATVGLCGELYMIFGWFGAIVVGAFLAMIALGKKVLYVLSGGNHHVIVLARSIGILYAILLLRSDMWILFVYMWLQVPILIGLAIVFSRLGRAHR